MVVGTLAALRRYPVKSLQGQALDEARIAPGGVDGDRTAALFVREGPAREGKTYRGKENERLHLTADAAEAESLAAQRGVRLELREGERFFDDAPISIVLDCWLNQLSALLGYAVQWERFRPNFFVRAAAGFARSETDLSGAQLQLGGAHLRVRSPIERCVTVTYDPQGNASDPLVLRMLAQHRDNLMGIYCEVVRPGVARAGDPLVLL